MKRLLILVLLLVLIVPAFAHAATVRLLRTGQTTCYDSTGTVIPCAGTGQDGDIKAGAAWPSPRFTVSGDCVTDNVTGLMWVKDGYLDMESFDQAITYANDLTQCGYSDWRLPNINELESLTNAEQGDQSVWLMSQGFTNILGDWKYQASTTHPSFTDQAWNIYLKQGNIAYGSKGPFPYREAFPVRGDSTGPGAVWKTGQTTMYLPGDDGDLQKGIALPSPRFSVEEDCVVDNLTGLMWPKDTSLSTLINWQAALDYSNNLTLCGYSDWRLPNKSELRSLIDFSHSVPALPPDHPFLNLSMNYGQYYWTSDTYAVSKSRAWAVDVGQGNPSYWTKGQAQYAWPVRTPMQVSMSPSSGLPGDTLLEWGMGFTPSGTATLHFKRPDGTEALALSQVIDAGGYFEMKYKAPADLPAGTYIIWAVDDATGVKSREGTFVIATPAAYTLTVEKSGSGKGTVTGDTITCGNTCSGQFAPGVQVTLTATPDSAYEFKGWTGACSGKGACVVTVNGNTTVGAIFQDRTAPVEHVVLLIVDGLGRDTFYNALDKAGATYPNLYSLFKESPYMRIDKVTGIFPTLSFPGNASIITGSYPATHGIAGNVWCDRSTVVCRDYTGADMLKVWEQGIAAADLKVPALYDVLAEGGLRSSIAFNMYGRNTENITWILPVSTDLADNIILDQEKYDNNMMYEALKQINSGGLPNLLTLHFGGHEYSVRKNGVSDSARYLQQVVDPLIGVLVEGGALERYGTPMSETVQFPGLTNGFPDELEKTVFVITSGHGMSTVGHTVSPNDIQSVLKAAGFDSEGFWTSVNGGMGHIYVRNRSTGAWTDYPQSTDLTLLKSALITLKDVVGADKVLVRDQSKTSSWNAPYKGYPKALSADDNKRVLKQSSIESGDIILIPKAGYAYDTSTHTAGSGGLGQEDSLVPLVFSGRPLEYNQKTIKNNTISLYDIAPTIAALLGVEMDADGKAIADVVKVASVMADISVPKSLSFGNVKLPKSSTKKLTVTNKGKKDLSIDQVYTNSAEFAITADTCSGKDVAPRKSCTVSIVFTPATKGDKSAAVYVPSSDPDTRAASAALKGKGM